MWLNVVALEIWKYPENTLFIEAPLCNFRESNLDTWHDDVIKWEHFPRYLPFVREFTGHWLIPLTKAGDGELWCHH